jgi:hypothetical protein
MKVYEGEGRGTGPEFIAPFVLASALFARQRSDSRFGHITPEEKVLCTRWIEFWVCPKAGLDLLENRNFRAPAETQTLDRLILVTIPTALSRINNTNTLATHLIYFHLLSNIGNTEACLIWLLWMMACAKDRKERCPIFVVRNCENGKNLLRNFSVAIIMQVRSMFSKGKYEWEEERHVFCWWEFRVTIDCSTCCPMFLTFDSLLNNNTHPSESQNAPHLQQVLLRHKQNYNWRES